MVPGTLTGTGSQALRHLSWKHVTLMGANEEERPERSLPEFLLFTVLIFNYFSTADENFLSGSVSHSLNKDAAAEDNDLCTRI